MPPLTKLERKDDVPAEKPMPEHLANMTFEADDALVASPIEKETPKSEQETETSPVKPIVPERTETVEPEADKGAEEKTEEVKEEKEEKPKGLKSFLKAPGSEKKEEEKKEEKTEVIKKITPNKITRDYTGFSPEEVAHFKQMSDGAYKYVTEVIKKNRELSKSSQEIFLQHPDAYTLTPDYAQAQRAAYDAQREGAIWADILNKCKRGESFKAPVEIDPKTGKFIFTEQEIKPDGDIEETVRANLLKCQQAVGEFSGKLRTMAESHKQRIQTDLQAIQQEQQRRFEWVSDPSLMDYSVEVEGLGQRTLHQVKEDFKSMIPPYYRGNPMADVAANSMIALRIQWQELQQALANQKVAEIKKEEAVRAEPTSKGKAIPKTKVNGVTEFTLEGAEGLTGLNRQ